MNITEFLEARIADDEELANAALVGMHGKHETAWDYAGYVLGAERDSTPKQDEFITSWWPARVLAECAAKRAILAEHAIDLDMRDPYCDTCAEWWKCEVGEGPPMVKYPCPTIRALTAVYKDHPDYQQEWAL